MPTVTRRSGGQGLALLGALSFATFFAASFVSLSSQPVRQPAVALQALSEEDSVQSRRGALAVAGFSALASAAPALAEEKAPVALPQRINENPYDLIGMGNPEDQKEDRENFYMKKKYRDDTYQVVKHMKISGSLDKGTPNMEKWNKRVKEEMDDWLALYRRTDSIVGRQSYYALYSAVNTLASHFTSYGPKFPFPNKRRARFYELINQAERYLEKGK
mmetsp:Transcript_55800/g.120595  ORF Transcript_55800/g.120595 Transcript_55800/m.120595 type:complete len:218 (+) Transcript_55800:52-705(+)